MIANIKRNVVFIALAVLVWFGYSDLDEVKDNAAAASKGPLRPIERADVEAVEPDPAWKLSRDPYGLVKAVAQVERKSSSGSPRAAAPSAAKPSAKSAALAAAGHMAGGMLLPGIASPTGHSLLHPAGVDLAHWREVAAAIAAHDTLTCDAPEPEPVPPPPPLPAVQFTLHLQSTLALADGGQARISGQTVAVGSALPGLDPYAPPVLLSVDGSAAVVSHRGRNYLLDLDHLAVVEVVAGGPEPVVAEADTPGAAAPAAAKPAAAPASGQAMGHKGGNPRVSNKAPHAPGPAKAAAPTPATAPAPGTTKKATYKVRSYPGKPKS